MNKFDELKGVYEALFNRLISANPNLVLVASAGNFLADRHDSDDVNNVIPASVANDNLIVVGAIDERGNAASFSMKGASIIDIAAPGQSVYVPTGASPDAYGKPSGTSFAAPMVAGVIGLMRAVDPDLSPAEIKSILRDTGDPADASVGGRRLNACRAVQTVLEQKGVDIPTSARCELQFPIIAEIAIDARGSELKKDGTLIADGFFSQIRAHISIPPHDGILEIPFEVRASGSSGLNPTEIAAGVLYQLESGGLGGAGVTDLFHQPVDEQLLIPHTSGDLEVLVGARQRNPNNPPTDGNLFSIRLELPAGTACPELVNIFFNDRFVASFDCTAIGLNN